jgi:hypothetical protein
VSCFSHDTTGDWQWMLAACRGEMWGEGALRMVSIVRASLRYWNEHDPATAERFQDLADALAEGDRRFPCDPRRHLAVEIGPERVEDIDPEGMALLDLRGAVDDPVAMASAIAAALQAGVPAETVRATVLEVRHG